ncbi:MAG: TerC family protein [Bacteroidota bacterium]
MIPGFGEYGILIIFGIIIVIVLALDLGVFQKKAHFPSMKEALAWSVAWIILSLLFNVYVFFTLGHVKGLEFFTGYLIEKALSVDNIFVFIVILTYFAVPKELQHKVLFWGVLGALLFRGIFIVLGAALIANFHWILYLLGAFLIYTAVKLAFQEGIEIEPENNPVLRYFKKHFPITDGYEGTHFFRRRDNRQYITPLFLVLVVIETSDIAFATDSIPAIFAISKDPIIVFTSNIFAVLGLRSLYFVLANFMKKFHYLQIGLSIVLGFIGAKMLVEHWIEIPIAISLCVIFGILLISILLSILRTKRQASATR